MWSYRLTSQPLRAAGAGGGFPAPLAGAQGRTAGLFLPHRVPALGWPRPLPPPQGRAVLGAAARHVLRRCRPPVPQHGSKAPITGTALCWGLGQGPHSPRITGGTRQPGAGGQGGLGLGTTLGGELLPPSPKWPGAASLGASRRGRSRPTLPEAWLTSAPKAAGDPGSLVTRGSR